MCCQHVHKGKVWLKHPTCTVMFNFLCKLHRGTNKVPQMCTYILMYRLHISTMVNFLAIKFKVIFRLVEHLLCFTKEDVALFSWFVCFHTATSQSVSKSVCKSHGSKTVLLLVRVGCVTLFLKSEAAGSFIAPLVAGCSTGHKPRPLHVNEWDFNQNKKINNTSNTIFWNMVLVI